MKRRGRHGQVRGRRGQMARPILPSDAADMAKCVADMAKWRGRHGQMARPTRPGGTTDATVARPMQPSGAADAAKWRGISTSGNFRGTAVYFILLAFSTTALAIVVSSTYRLQRHDNNVPGILTHCLSHFLKGTSTLR